MNLTIDLPENETLELKDKAKAWSLHRAIHRQVLEHDIAPDWFRESWADARQNSTDQLTMEEIEAEIAAAPKSAV